MRRRGIGCRMLNYSIDDLDALRLAELRLLLRRHGHLFLNADVLEIGSGTGIQLQELERVARSATGVEVRSSHLPPRSSLTYYDGETLPFADASFDVIYSSNTMEHVLNEPRLHAEMKRVLRPGGVAIHVVPSSAWRLWSTVTHFLMLPKIVLSFLRRRSATQPGGGGGSTVSPRSARERMLDLLSPSRHGERGNRFTEWWHFRAATWRKRFVNLGWRIDRIDGAQLFYTQYLLWPSLFPIERRERLSRFLGSACLVVVTMPRGS